jgi:DNA replication and repair protein RecF
LIVEVLLAILERVYLRNFRLFREREFVLKEGINIICGKNGSGKTSFLESIYVLNYGKSFRTKEIKEIRREKDFYIEGKIRERGFSDIIRFYYDGEKKVSFLGEKKIKISDMINKFFSIYLNSDKIQRFFKERSEGRKTIDLLCSGINPLYLKELLKYNRILRNRNKLLKSIVREDFNYKSWTENLIVQGKVIKEKRDKFLKEINEILSIKKIELRLIRMKEEKNLFFKEKRYKRTLFGPHLDFVKVFKEGKDLKIFGSTGINKSVFFDIVDGYIKIYNEKRGSAPLLMLDDFDSDLDYDNLKKNINRFESQTILSFVNDDFNFNEGVNIMEV